MENEPMILANALHPNPVTTISPWNLGHTFSNADSEQQAHFFNAVGRNFREFKGVIGAGGQVDWILNGMDNKDSQLDDNGRYFIELLIECFKE